MVCHEVCHELVNRGPDFLWPGDEDDGDNEIGETSEEIISNFETTKDPPQDTTRGTKSWMKKSFVEREGCGG